MIACLENKEDRLENHENNKRIRKAAGWRTNTGTRAVATAQNLELAARQNRKEIPFSVAVRQNLRITSTKKCHTNGCKPVNFPRRFKKRANATEKHAIFWMGRQNLQEVSSHQTSHKLNVTKKSMGLFLKPDKIIPIFFLRKINRQQELAKI